MNLKYLIWLFSRLQYSANDMTKREGFKELAHIIVETGKAKSLGQAGTLASSWYNNMTLHLEQANKLESYFLFMLQYIGRFSFLQRTSSLSLRAFQLIAWDPPTLSMVIFVKIS